MKNKTIFLLIFLVSMVFAILIMPAKVLAATPQDIIGVNIKNFNEPKIGEKVGDAIPKEEDIELKFADGSANSIITSLEFGYGIEEIISGTVTQKKLSPDDRFEQGIYYFILDISVDENLGNFPYDTKYSYLGEITINGEKLKYIDMGEAEKNEITIALLFDFRDTINIDDLNFTIYPTTGMKVKDVPNIFSDYIIDGEYSKKTTDGWENMNKDDVFETGKKYSFLGGALSLKHCLKKDNLNVVETHEENGTSETIYEAYMNINGKKTLVYVESRTENGLSIETIYIRDFIFEIKEQITVSFDNNGYGKNPDTQTIKPGEKVVKPDDLKEKGFVFAGWFTDKECENEFNFDAKVYDDLILYAKWTEEEIDDTPFSPILKRRKR